MMSSRGRGSSRHQLVEGLREREEGREKREKPSTSFRSHMAANATACAACERKKEKKSAPMRSCSLHRASDPRRLTALKRKRKADTVRLKVRVEIDAARRFARKEKKKKKRRRSLPRVRAQCLIDPT